jgi:hypothetical protein
VRSQRISCLTWRRRLHPRSTRERQTTASKGFCVSLRHRVDNGARELPPIAGGTEDATILDRARVAAQAELDLARIRAVKIAVIERVLAVGNLTLPRGLVADGVRLLKAIKVGRLPAMPEQVDFSATIPTLEPDRSAEAVRRALPELLKLERYERRAAALRDRAIGYV